MALASRDPPAKPEENFFFPRGWDWHLANRICPRPAPFSRKKEIFFGFCGRIPACRSQNISFILNGKKHAKASTGGHADNGNGSLAPPVPLDRGMSKNEGWAKTTADECQMRNLPILAACGATTNADERTRRRRACQTTALCQTKWQVHAPCVFWCLSRVCFLAKLFSHAGQPHVQGLRPCVVVICNFMLPGTSLQPCSHGLFFLRFRFR